MAEQTLTLSTHSKVQYKDLTFRIAACIIATHIMLADGETIGTFQMLMMRSYYYSLLGSVLIAMLLFSAIRSIVRWLDRKFDWQTHMLERTAMQLLCGLILPSILAFLLAAIYFQVRGGINILHTHYLRNDFTFIVALLLMINLYYFAYYFFVRWRQAQQLLAHAPAGAAAQTEPQRFKVSKGAGTQLLLMEDIAYCYREEDANFLYTVSGERYFIPDTLDDIQTRLPEQQFFRANRQVIINRDACKSYDLLTYGKLKANLHPAHQEEVVISQKRAPEFKKWIESAQP